MAVFEDIWGFHTWSRDAKGPWKGQDTAECPAKTGPPYHKALFGPKRQQCEVEKPWSRPSGAAREDPRVSVLHGCFLLPLVLSLTGGVRGERLGAPQRSTASSCVARSKKTTTSEEVVKPSTASDR